MTNTVMNTNKKESKLQAIFKDDNPKLSMILNAITAAIWVFITAMNLYSLNEYAHVNTFRFVRQVRMVRSTATPNGARTIPACSPFHLFL